MDDIEVRALGRDELERMVIQEELDRAQFSLLPEDIAPLIRYIAHKIEPGSFLRAVLENNLSEAMGRADMYNRRKIFEYVQWLYNEAPADCWGSPQNVHDWLYGKALNGDEA